VPRGAAAVRASKVAAATATTWWIEEAATAWSGVGVRESAGERAGRAAQSADERLEKDSR